MSRRPVLTLWLVLVPSLLLGLSGCKGNYGGVKINVTLIGDAKTKCLKGWVVTSGGTTIYSDPIPRSGDTYVFGIQGSEELSGQVSVGVELHAASDCGDAQWASQMPLGPVTIKRGEVTTVNLTFDFSEHPDGGTDGGLDDGGTDGGGCVPSMCTTPPSCHGTPGTCGASGCEYPLLTEGSDCGDGGVCNAAGQCGSNVCLFRDAGAPCDDGLACTTDTCVAGACQGACAVHLYDTCNDRVLPAVCGADGGCAWTPKPPNGPCSPDGGGAAIGRCNAVGWCDPWFALPPSNLPDDVTALPQPTQGWTAAAGADGGPCVIDTSGATPGPRDPSANCGFTGQAMTFAQDGGPELAVFRATELLVPPGVEVQFVGARPAVLAIFGDATVYGTLNAAASAASADLPAGSGSTACSVQGAPSDREGGAGGSYRTMGGTGGNDVLTPGAVNGSVDGVPLRGGCAGDVGGGPQPGDGGVGGGALQLTVSGALTVGDGGVLTVSGAGGFGGLGDKAGAGGGGSGGTVLLEARKVSLLNCVITANGGGGGQGGKNGQPLGETGTDGSQTSNTAASGGNTGGIGGNGGAGAVNALSGGNGSNGGGTEGGGGGGAGVGLIRINSFEPCVMSNEIRSGEKKTSNSTCN